MDENGAPAAFHKIRRIKGHGAENACIEVKPFSKARFVADPQTSNI
jgi:hypothetical protein